MITSGSFITSLITAKNFFQDAIDKKEKQAEIDSRDEKKEEEDPDSFIYKSMKYFQVHVMGQKESLEGVPLIAGDSKGGEMRNNAASRNSSVMENQAASWREIGWVGGYNKNGEMNGNEAEGKGDENERKEPGDDNRLRMSM